VHCFFYYFFIFIFFFRFKFRVGFGFFLSTDYVAHVVVDIYILSVFFCIFTYTYTLSLSRSPSLFLSLSLSLSRAIARLYGLLLRVRICGRRASASLFFCRNQRYCKFSRDCLSIISRIERRACSGRSAASFPEEETNPVCQWRSEVVRSRKRFARARCRGMCVTILSSKYILRINTIDAHWKAAVLHVAMSFSD